MKPTRWLLAAARRTTPADRSGHGDGRDRPSDPELLEQPGRHVGGGLWAPPARYSVWRHVRR